MNTKITIPDTELTFHPLGLGTVNAGLAWDGADADRIFDTFVDMGGNLIDTAHVYSDWVGPERARSERVVGDWLERSRKRSRVVLVTKGGHPEMQQYHREHPGNLLMPYMGVCSGYFHKYTAKGADSVKGSAYDTVGNRKTAERIKELCKKYNATVTQAVLGFFGQQDFACAPLYGPKNAGQVEEAMRTFEIPFTREDYDV